MFMNQHKSIEINHYTPTDLENIWKPCGQYKKEYSTEFPKKDPLLKTATKENSDSILSIGAYTWQIT